MKKHEYMGKFLKKARQSQGLSQTDLGHKLKVTPQFISNWERGKCSPPMGFYKKISRVLKISHGDLRDVAASIAYLEMEKALK